MVVVEMTPQFLAIHGASKRSGEGHDGQRMSALVDRFSLIINPSGFDIPFIALTLNALGSIFIGYAALRVHHRVLNEKSIDQDVLKTMRLEQVIGWIGIALIVIAYLITIFA